MAEMKTQKLNLEFDLNISHQRRNKLSDLEVSNKDFKLKTCEVYGITSSTERLTPMKQIILKTLMKHELFHWMNNTS